MFAGWRQAALKHTVVTGHELRLLRLGVGLQSSSCGVGALTASDDAFLFTYQHVSYTSISIV